MTPEQRSKLAAGRDQIERLIRGIVDAPPAAPAAGRS
jgi:hypothetical protein